LGKRNATMNSSLSSDVCPAPGGGVRTNYVDQPHRLVAWRARIAGRADDGQAEGAHFVLTDHPSESIGTLAAYNDHLARFPNCVFSTLAAARIEALKK
jgi:hypothetical protein